MYPTEIITLGDHMRAWRLDLRLFWKDVARKIGITAYTTTEWKRKRRSLNFSLKNGKMVYVTVWE
jgi:hypothetical protein